MTLSLYSVIAERLRLQLWLFTPQCGGLLTNEKRQKRARNSYHSNKFSNVSYLIRWKISNEEERWHIFSCIWLSLISLSCSLSAVRELIKKKKVHNWALLLLYAIVCFFYALLSILAISASFERGTSVTYALQEPFSVIRKQEPKQLQSNKHPDTVRSQENVAFGFLTKHAPALLLSALSHDHRYMAVTLTQNGKSYLFFENSWVSKTSKVRESMRREECSG